VRFHYLPLEYWQARILFEIVGTIGTPITIDENTSNLAFGHYARVLVDINMADFLPDSLGVERDFFFLLIVRLSMNNCPIFVSLAILLAILLIIVKKTLPIKLLLKRLPPNLTLDKNPNQILFLKGMLIQ